MPTADANHEQSRHVVVVVGGAVAGSEAALACAERGAWAIVLEQGARPFGKIEDGLPRWHEKLRVKEYEQIAKNLAHPGVSFVPRTMVGRDVALATILREWGVSALLLGCGAWRDRPLFEGAEAFYGRGLVPQNAFVHWYNHYPERDYDGPAYAVPDHAIVVGGGLASIDVAKIINLELYKRALAARGHKLSTVELEHEGIAPVLARLGITQAELGVRGVTLFYRRDKGAMPIASAPDDATPEQRAKVVQVRARLIDKVIERYLVRFAPNHAVHAPLVEDGTLVGLTFQRTRSSEDGRLELVPDALVNVRSPLVVSSIGSIPQPIPGLPLRGELIDFANPDTGAVRGLDGVFCLGNALTGKGNIKDSRRNAASVATLVAESYLGLRERAHELSPAHQHAHERAAAVAAQVMDRPQIEGARIARLREVVAALQRCAGFDGNLDAWLRASERDVHEADAAALS